MILLSSCSMKMNDGPFPSRNSTRPSSSGQADDSPSSICENGMQSVPSRVRSRFTLAQTDPIGKFPRQISRLTRGHAEMSNARFPHASLPPLTELLPEAIRGRYLFGSGKWRSRQSSANHSPHAIPCFTGINREKMNFASSKGPGAYARTAGISHFQNGFP